MEKKFKLGVVGAGYMASSIINGAVDDKFLSVDDIFINDLNETTLKKYYDKGFCVTNDTQLIFDNCKFILLSVKPQNFTQVAEKVRVNKDNVLISIMAGVTKDKIRQLLGVEQVVRCMPNAPCAVKNGAIGLDSSLLIDKNDVSFVKSLFSAVASVVELDESLLNVVTGISGSAPAYFYLFAKGIIEAGVKNGLSYEDAKLLVVNTMIGSGKMLFENSKQTIDSLIDSVCSKGGTTLEAIKVYNDMNLSNISIKAVDACIKRAEELEKL